MTKNPPYYVVRNGRAFFSLGKDRARRERNGSKLRSRNTLGGEDYQARKAFAERIRRETE